MEDLPDAYTVDSVEQMRAIADRLRLRIIELLAHQPMTVAQMSDQLHLAHAKVHYHVRELEQVGLVRLVETREKGGILEKYYRSVAKSIAIAPTLLSTGARDESVEIASRLLADLTASFLRALGRWMKKQEGDNALAGMSAASLFVTEDEATELSRRMSGLLEPYAVPRGIEGEREVMLVRLLFTDDSSEDVPAAFERAADVTSPAAPPPLPPAGQPAATAGRKHDHVAIVVGSSEFSRGQLESLAARGERLAIYALGTVTFADDVPAELVEHVVRRARLRGRLNASPAVRAVIERKEKD